MPKRPGVFGGGGRNFWELKGGNAQQGGLQTFYAGVRPGSKENNAYYPMHKKIDAEADLGDVDRRRETARPPVCTEGCTVAAEHLRHGRRRPLHRRTIGRR